MKRSSSKLLSKVGSVRNLNKLGFKFKIDLVIESVDKILSNSDVCLTWERGNKVISTNSVQVDKNTRIAVFDNGRLAHEVTLFKRKKDPSNFDAKIYFLCLRNNNESGKVIGRIAINLSDHVRVNSVSKRIAAQLNNGSHVTLTFASCFLHEVKRGKGGSKGSSGSTIDDGLSMASADDLANLQDFADLEIVDLEKENVDLPSQPLPSAPVPSRSIPNRATNRGPPVSLSQPDIPSTSFDSVTPSQAPRQPASQSDEGSLIVRNPSGSSSGVSFRKGRSGDSKRPPRLGKYESGSRSGSDVGVTDCGSRLARSRNRSDTDVSTDGDGKIKSNFESVRRENHNLRRKNDDLQSRLSDLERQLDTLHDADKGHIVDDLTAENKELKSYIDDLETKLYREPVYSDVVKELREAKMALAIFTLEKDELLQELRRLRR